jgi:mRNA-degrading endonuclease RelE of RelBE toxin-antitoxin system
VPFRIEWKKSTRKDLRKLPARTVQQIVETVGILAENPFPHGVEKLSGSQHASAFVSATIELFMKS